MTDPVVYRKGADSLIRATEGTVMERIPPRLEVRRDASIELPHVMLLIDNPERTVIEPLTAAAGGMEKVYDFELMQNGGHIRGYKLSAEQIAADRHVAPEVIEASLIRSRELLKQRSLWITMGFFGILICTIVSLIVNYPSPVV